VRSGPAGDEAHPVLALQRQAGNRAVAGALSVQREPHAGVLDNGFLTRPVSLSDHTFVPAGTYVEVTGRSGERLQVMLHSGFGGRRTTVPADAFEHSPQVTDASGGPGAREDVRFTGAGAHAVLWGPDGPHVEDVAQGEVGDCPLIARLAAMALFRPADVEGLFPVRTPGLSEYPVSLHTPLPGDPDHRTVVRVPAARMVHTPGGAQDVLAPWDGAPPQRDVAAHAGGGEGAAPVLWPMLLERAVAEVEKGYAGLDAGGGDLEFSRLLTGRAGRFDSIEHMGPHGMLRYLDRQLRAGRLITVGTRDGPADKLRPGLLERTIPLVLNHDYAVTMVDVQNGLIALQNPWGNTQPRPITPAELRTYFDLSAVTP
jgi:hypothetical protein